MISRQDIDAEAEMIKRLGEMQNPTGGAHTPTPWHKGEDTWERVDATVKEVMSEPNWPGRSITDQQGNALAFFLRPEDRDLALYFTNVHSGLISILRDQVHAWEFMRMAVGSDSPAADFCTKQMDILKAYADLFCRLGKVEDDDVPR